MPGISRFFGIVIYMYANDHGPVKHFHAEYNGHWAKYSFDGDLIKGGLPRKQNVLCWHGLKYTVRILNPIGSALKPMCSRARLSRLGREVALCAMT